MKRCKHCGLAIQQVSAPLLNGERWWYWTHLRSGPYCDGKYRSDSTRAEPVDAA